VDGVTQRVIHVESDNKRPLLVELLADPKMSRTLVFTRTKRGADRVARHLETAGIRVAAIHGNKSQSQREQALAAFRASRIRVLVATDIAARGIDIDQVTHVVNFELPDVAESYVHRIGRTARAGSQGIAISLCDAEERDQLRAIERLTRQSIPAEDRRDKAARRPSRQSQASDARSTGFRSASAAGRRHKSQAERRHGRTAPRPAAA
jgi:ATP-dependent RNA helicase RhlE